MTIAVTLVLGVAMGMVLGFALSSSIQSWLGHREWKEASRELELADRLLETLVEDATSVHGPVVGTLPPGRG